MKTSTKLLVAGLLIYLSSSLSNSFAAPIIWETNYGSELVDLTGGDDEQTLVSLSFNFNFAGINYVDFLVGTNGAIQAANSSSEAGDDDEIYYDNWAYMYQFLDDGTPIFAPFSTDLDLSTTGSIHFNDFGDRAVFTWNEVGTNTENEHLATFQLQLLLNGSIIFGYNGLFDNLGEDYIDSLGEGILVGITNSDNPTAPATSDLNGGSFTAGNTAFELWCYDAVNSCDGFNGPLNSAFDLDQTNVVFTPTAMGFEVSSMTSNTPVNVPSPSALSLFALGLIGLALRKTK